MTKKKKPKKNKKTNNEEVDLIVFFSLIGNGLTNVFNFIGSFFKAVFSTAIYGLKIIFKYFKIILPVVIIAALVGYGLDYTKPVHYQSEMLVETHFDSKYQLINNIKHLNALVNTDDENALNAIFNSDSTPKVDVASLKGFKIEPAPETEIERLIKYKEFANEQDTLILKELDYEKFVETKNIYSSNRYIITAVANKKDVFKRLGYGVRFAFTNDYSAAKKTKAKQLYTLQKQNIETSIAEVDTLQAIYVDILQKNTEKTTQPLKLEGLLVDQDTKPETREFDLLNKELQLRKQLITLEEKNKPDDIIVEVVSNFQPVGQEEAELINKRVIRFPIIAFLFLFSIYIIKRVVIYTIHYED